MLRNLIRKDLIMNGRHFWGFAPFFLWIAYAVCQPGALEMSTIMAAFAGTLVAATLVAREDKFHATALLYSLPIRRRTLVLSRYLMAIVVGVGSFLIAASLAAVLPWSPHAASRAFDPRSLLFMLALVGTTMAVMLPFVMRFGLIGVLAFMLVLQLAGVAAFMMTALFGSGQSLRPVMQAIEGTLVGLHRGLAVPSTIAATALVVSVAIWGSYRLSVVLADRRGA